VASRPAPAADRRGADELLVASRPAPAADRPT
jgi:hypothetical protein